MFRLALSLVCSLFVVQAVQAQDVPCTGDGPWLRCIETDQALYAPGTPVRFTATLAQPTGASRLHVRYRHLDAVVGDQPVTPSGNLVSWSWTPPETDGLGYLVELEVLGAEGAVLDRIQTAVDVSSSWKRFPRYGFLGDFATDAGQPLSQERIDAVIARLNRFHINGLQFYDWQYKHHDPLRGTAEAPASGWRDIANRPVYFATIDSYIDAAHERGMKAMAYNLLFGAFRNAAQDGVDMQAWGLFTNAAATAQDFHDLPSSWASDIMLMNPASPGWQQYILDAMAETFAALPFDGWHVDQLGKRGTVYDGQGNVLDLAATYKPFLEAADARLQNELVMNAVSQYGQSQIAGAPVSFLYSEVWPPEATTFTHLRQVINQNDNLGRGLPTVLAAYMNYDLAQRPGFFNTPAVLLTDAVIFASGGAHLELGEHMLSREYFPADNLAMRPELEDALVNYYDFLVAYQNLLRDNLDPTALTLRSAGGPRITGYQLAGGIWSFAREKGDRQVAHLINLADATTLNWRDDQGTQAEPTPIADLALSFAAKRPVRALWAASPDTAGGAPVALAFDQADGVVSLSLPYLKYWTMLVIEYEPAGVGAEALPAVPSGTALGRNYPEPFADETRIPYTLGQPAPASLRIYDMLGRLVRTLLDGMQGAGAHEALWNGRDDAGAAVPSGVYLCRLETSGRADTRTLILIR